MSASIHSTVGIARARRPVVPGPAILALAGSVVATLACAGASAQTDPGAAPSYRFKRIDIDPQQETVLLQSGKSGAILGLDLTTTSATCDLLQGALQTPIADPAGIATSCQGMNAAGTIVGYYETAQNVAVGFVYAGGSYADFVPPNGMTGLVPTAISDGGAIAGYYYDAEQGAHAFVSEGATFKTFSLPGITNLFPVGLNDRGVMTIQAFDTGGAVHAYLKAGARIIELAVPGSVETVIERINNRNQAVGTYFDAAGGQHGFAYDAVKAAYYTIDVPGAAATALDGIDDTQALVGDYRATAGGPRQGMKGYGSLP